MSIKSTKVGIDAISVHIPRLFLSLTDEWAHLRAPIFSYGSVGNLIEKLEKGIGVTKIALPDMHEDPATMAAMAVKRLIDDNNIDPTKIGYLAIGTESSVDQSKSIATYVLGMLEEYYKVKLDDIGCIEFKSACISATYALESAANLIRSGELARPYAIVVATDIAKYDLYSSSECTQGAGSVALLIKKSPRLMILESSMMATFSCNERDFFRPNWRLLPVVDGKHSINIYCESVANAFERYTEQFFKRFPKASKNKVMDYIDYMIFHVPFPRMAEYAAVRLLLPIIHNNKKIYEEIDIEERKLLEKELLQHSKFRDFFDNKVAKSLEISKEVGNIYSGSLYLALVSLLETSLRDDVELNGKRVVMCSYGSGSSAKVFSGLFTNNWRKIAKNLDTFGKLRPMQQGGMRYQLSVEMYEKIHKKDNFAIGIRKSLVTKLKNNTPLDAEESKEVYMSLINPQIIPNAIGESIVQPTDEFVLESYGNKVTKEKTDIDFRYYSYRS